MRFEQRNLVLQNVSDPREDQMNFHKNAKLTPFGRERLALAMQRGLSRARPTDR